jgi:N-acetylglucosaminyldiphosphoundecaprenol N-acetyl-beta-D-mannosaminyltransferase
MSIVQDDPVATIAGVNPTDRSPTRRATRASALVSVFGVRISSLSEPAAVALLEQMIVQPASEARTVYFVNAHTLNLAAERSDYRNVLNRASCVFGDGTGVRWAARTRGVQIEANLNGTDLVPRLFRDTAGRGYRCFLLGATADTLARAAANAEKHFAGWTFVGFHHGYLDANSSRQVIRQINAARPHLLLVGMGNPLQEQWIDSHRGDLNVPLCIGTGGLFDHWAGNLRRAPRWVRSLGCEWLQLLLQQPHKWRRYLLGNPRFLWRMMAYRRGDMAAIADNTKAER